MANSRKGSSSRPKATTVNRSAKSGQFVTPSYAKRHKGTTVTERVKRK